MADTLKLEGEIRAWIESVPFSEDRRRVSAVFLSKPIILALDGGETKPVVRWMSEVESRLGDKRTVLDFGSCKGIQQMVRMTCDRLMRCGRGVEATTLGETFKKYFDVSGEGYQANVGKTTEWEFTMLGAATLLEAMEKENVFWAVSHLSKLESQCAEKGIRLDFSDCEELKEAVLAAYGRSWINGDLSMIQSLQRSFGKYFTLPKP
jgi:hypothetical protein